MKSGTSTFNSIFIAYVAWAFTILINFTFTFYTSDFKDKIGSDMTEHFLTMIVLAFIVTHGIGATLAWYAQKRKNWAKWLFILFCISFALDSLFRILEITEMYKLSNNNQYKDALAIIVWCMLAGMAWVKSSNKSFKPTPKSGAV